MIDRRLLLLSLLLIASTHAKDAIPDQEKIERLVRELGNENVAVRDEGEKKLIGIGPQAAAAVERHQEDADLEIRVRISRILKEIRRIESHRTLLEKAGEPTRADLPQNVRGIKVLVDLYLYDPDAQTSFARIEELHRYLREEGVAVTEKLLHGSCWLLDFGKQDPYPLLERLPHRMGAMIFANGLLWDRLPIPQSSSSDRKGDIPAPFASLRWGSGDGDIKRMETDKRWLKDARMKSELVNHAAPGWEKRKCSGNPWEMRILPAEKSTLLEVFLLTRAEFKYVDPKRED